MSTRRPRSDAERHTAAILDSAARQLAAGGNIEMRRVARDAGVSRSTLYRHFADAAALRRAVRERARATTSEALHGALSEPGPPLAVLRRTLAALAEVGRRDPSAQSAADGDELIPVIRQLAELAGLEPDPDRRLLRAAAADLVEHALGGDMQRLFERVTEPLDQGLVVLDRRGRLVARNALADEALSLGSAAASSVLPPIESVYEDGYACPPDRHPIAVAAATGREQARTLRGHVMGDGQLRWFSIEAVVLRRAQPYAVVAVLRDVTAERRNELSRLHAPGSLGRGLPVPIDVVRVLDEIPAALLPEQLIAEARRLVAVPVALYVVDIDGSQLLRLAGSDEFPAQVAAPLALGPELAESGLADLRTAIARRLPGAVMAPMWLRGRAVGVLVGLRAAEEVLGDVARLAAPAIELANGYTDVFDAARRRKEINPAAEIQQSLLPPRIARLSGAEVAAGVLPSYEVGGDWFDYVENRDGAWIAIADAAGRGPHAGALGGVGLAALRAARRNEANLEQATQTIHETLLDAGEVEFFLTALVAHWSPPHSVLSWINAGHPPPLVLRPSGAVEEFTTQPSLPLGLGERERSYRRSYRRLARDERVIFYTDGVSARRTRDGFFGTDGIAAAAAGAGEGRPAAEIARAIQEAVVAASDKPLRDDAAVVVLAPSG